MNLLERYIPPLRRRAERHATEQRRASALQRAYSSVVGSIQQMRTELLGYMFGNRSFVKHFRGWVAACIETRAEAMADLEWRVYVERRGAQSERENAPSGHWMVELMKRPNPVLEWVTWWDIIAGVDRWQSVEGAAYIWTPTDGGRYPMQMWVLPADVCRPVPGKDADGNETIYAGVMVRTPWGEWFLDKREVIYLPLLGIGSESVGDWSTSHPASGSIIGRSRIAQAIDAVEVNNYTMSYLQAYFARHAMPEFIITSEQEVYDSDKENMMKRWLERHQGPESLHPIGFLGQGQKVIQLDTTANKEALQTMSEHNQTTICASFGTPKGMVTGEFDMQAPASSYQSTRFVFYRRTLSPSAKRIGASLTHWAQRYDPLTIIGHEPIEWHDPAEVRADEEHRMATGQATINELLEEHGRKPLPKGAGGDVRFFNPSLATLESLIAPPVDQREATPALPDAQTPAEDAEFEVEESARRVDVHTPTKRAGLLAAGDIRALRNGTDAQTSDDEERIITAVWRKVDDIAADGAKSIKGSVADAYEELSDEVLRTMSAGFDLDEWRERFGVLSEPEILAVLDAAMTWAISEVGRNPDDFESVTDRVRERAIDDCVEKVRTVVGTAKQELGELLRSMKDAPVEEQRDAIKKKFGHYTTSGAERIARTTATYTTNRSSREAWEGLSEETGKKIDRIWMSSRDGDVRPDHKDADGQKADDDGYFRVGGEKIKQPGDGSGENAINCRCFTRPRERA